MKRVTLIATALVLTVLAVLTVRVSAQQTNTQEVSYLTFSNSVELPGTTLPAGTYTFRLADTPSRNVVQVLDRDQKNVMGQWLFVQAQRAEVSDDTVIMFKENREGSTPAVQYWYFPGEKIGKEFIYPKDQAVKIAARTGQKVRTETGYVSSDTAVSSTDSQGQVSEWQREGSPAANSASTSDNAVVGTSGVSAEASADSTLRDAPASSQPTASAGSLTGNRGVDTTAHADTTADAHAADAAADAKADNQVAADTTANSDRSAVGTSGSSDNRAVGTSGQAEGQVARAEALPKTASPLALSGLIGLLSLAGALGTRAFAATRS
jgi:hypothetical protein